MSNENKDKNRDVNLLPLEIEFSEEGRINVTAFKFDSGSFLLQNNDKGPEDDKLQKACSDVDAVDKILDQLFGELRKFAKAKIANMENKYQGVDIFLVVEDASTGITDDVEIAEDAVYTPQQLLDAVELLIDNNPTIENRVYGRGGRLGVGINDLRTALAKVQGKGPEIINRPRIQGSGKHFYDKNKKKTPFGNKTPDKDQNNSDKVKQNQPTNIRIEESGKNN